MTKQASRRQYLRAIARRPPDQAARHAAGRPGRWAIVIPSPMPARVLAFRVLGVMLSVTH
jgi:hypothetical protein